MPAVIIGADICPIERNREYFMRGDAESLFNNLLDEFKSCDLAIANLECPLIDHASPIQKTGPVFGEPGACVAGIKNAGIQVLNLANNHILDHGPEGLKNTIATCESAGLLTVGAGENLAAARRMLIVERGGCRIAILSVAEHEFSIAGKNRWGANPLNTMDFVRNVRDNRSRFDYLIVLFHGGDEFLVPSPRVKDTCHFMIESGASAVIVQHPHCLGGYESYRGGHIVYGQGALVMDEALYRNRKSFHESYLVKLAIDGEFRSAMEIVPFVHSDPMPGARRMDPEREKAFRRDLAERSRNIADDKRVEEDWRRFCLSRKHAYVSCLLGHNRIVRKLNSLGWITRFFYKKQTLLSVANVVRCETHREAVETIIDEGWH